LGRKYFLANVFRIMEIINTRSFSTKTLIVDSKNDQLDTILKQIASDDQARVTVCVSYSGDIQDFLRPIMFYLMERELNICVITVSFADCNTVLRKLKFLKRSTRLQVFVTNVKARKLSSRVVHAVISLCSKAFHSAPIMVYTPNIYLKKRVFLAHENCIIFDKQSNRVAVRSQRDDLRFQRFFSHATLLWVHDAFWEEGFYPSVYVDTASVLNHHGIRVLPYHSWKKVPFALKSPKTQHPLLRIIASKDSSVDPVIHFKMIQAIRVCLRKQTPILVFTQDLSKIEMDMFDFPYVKATDDMGVLLQYALMKPVPWAPRTNQKFEIDTDDWRGRMTVHDIVVNNTHTRSGSSRYYCVVTVHGQVARDYKTRAAANSVLSTWRDLDWTMEVDGQTQVDVTVYAGSKRDSRMLVGGITLHVSDLLELLPNKGPLCIERTFKLINNVKKKNNEVNGTVTLTTRFVDTRYEAKTNLSKRKKRALSVRSSKRKRRSRSGSIMSRRPKDILSKKRNKSLQRYFGCPLQESVSRALRDGVTPVIQACCIALEKKGFNLEGLLRIPGHRERIYKLKYYIETGVNVNLSREDPFDIVGLLKEYLKDLQGSLMPPVRLQKLLNIDLRSKKAEKLVKDEIDCLSPEHRDAWDQLIRYFLHLERHKEINKMTFKNIALSTVGSLFPPKASLKPDEVQLAMTRCTMLLQFMLVHAQVLFSKANTTLRVP